jgi:hypothetical protein
MPIRRRLCRIAGAALLGTLLLAAASAQAAVPLTEVINDPFSNPQGQHATAVEPDTFAFGNTIVVVSQVGRNFDAGASSTGFATSTNGGASWTSGVLPGLTIYQSPPGPYARASDPVVAYDPKHDVWLVQSVVLIDTMFGPNPVGVVVNRSTDGGLTWSAPIVSVDAPGDGADKNWIVCDTHASSPFYGRCYQTWGNGFGVLLQNYSTDGGLTWSTPAATADSATGIGGQPLVQPDGDVIIPAQNDLISELFAFRSTNGGVSWSAKTTITPTPVHLFANMRTDPLPSAEIDAAGKVYVVWQDCRFRAGCTVNDLVMTTSTDGVSWTPVTRVPIDPVTSTVEHFIPGLGVDATTSGAGAKLGLAYYFYRNTCSGSPCQLEVGYVQSDNGGATWSNPIDVAGPFSDDWIANTGLGRMVGDYISTSWMNGRAWPAFAIASAPTGPVFDEPIAVPTGGIDLSPYPDAVVDDDPAGYWRFGEPSGPTALDSSGNGNDGTYLGGPSLGVPGALAGDPDTAVRLDGVNDTVRVPDDSTLDVGNTFTAEGWIKRTSTTKVHELMNKSFQLTVMGAANGNQVFLRKPGVSTIARTTGGIGTGAYHHIAVTKNGSGPGSVKFYIDGALAPSVDVSAAQVIVDNNTLLTFGAAGSTSADYDEFAIYDGVLSATRIKAHYDAAVPGP